MILFRILLLTAHEEMMGKVLPTCIVSILPLSHFPFFFRKVKGRMQCWLPTFRRSQCRHTRIRSPRLFWFYILQRDFLHNRCHLLVISLRYFELNICYVLTHVLLRQNNFSCRCLFMCLLYSLHTSVALSKSAAAKSREEGGERERKNRTTFISSRNCLTLPTFLVAYHLLQLLKIGTI